MCIDGLSDNCQVLQYNNTSTLLNQRTQPITLAGFDQRLKILRINRDDYAY